MKKMNMVVAQSGGPSMVINQSLVGAVAEARKSPRIGKILGARHGILGILGGDYVDLRKQSAKKLAAIAATPSSALGSCRRKPDAADCRAIFEAFRKLLRENPSNLNVGLALIDALARRANIDADEDQMRENDEIRWSVQVMEKTYELTADPHTDLYLTGAYSADADTLDGSRPEAEEVVSSGAAQGA